MVTKTQLIELIDFVYGVECHLAGTLGEDELVSSGQPDNWNARDTLVHGAEWMRRVCRRPRDGTEGRDSAPTGGRHGRKREDFRYSIGMPHGLRFRRCWTAAGRRSSSRCRR